MIKTQMNVDTRIQLSAVEDKSQHNLQHNNHHKLDHTDKHLHVNLHHHHQNLIVHPERMAFISGDVLPNTSYASKEKLCLFHAQLERFIAHTQKCVISNKMLLNVAERPLQNNQLLKILL
jgi:hypothetical protein